MPEAVALIRKEDEEQLVKAGIPQEGIRRFLPRRARSGFPSRTIILMVASGLFILLRTLLI